MILAARACFQRLGDDAAHRAHALDALGQRVVLPLGRQRGEDAQVHARVVRVAGEPGFLRGEADEGREPGGQAVEQPIEHGAHGAPARRMRRVAIERILADVEVEGREIDRAEVMQRHEHLVEGEVFAPASDVAVEAVEPVQHPALQRGQLGRRQALAGVEIGEVAQQVAQRVAQPAVGIDLMAQDLVADPEIFGVVRAHHPEPEDVGAVALVHLLRRDDVAERLRHLAPLAVDHEAVGEHGVVGRAAAGAAGFEQRAVEPAPVLVRAFEVERGRPHQLRPLLQDEAVGGAALEPDIEDVGDLVVGVRVVLRREEARLVAGEPGVGAFLLDHGGDALDHLRIAQRGAVLARDEDRDRHAPDALAREHPVRPGLDHRADAGAAGRRHPAHVVDGVERGAAEAGRLHADEPLARVAEDQRRLGAPGVGIGVDHFAAREQVAGIGQRVGDLAVHLVDVLAGEARHVIVEAAVVVHRRRGLDRLAIAAARSEACVVERDRLEILGAVARRDVDEAGALLGGDVIGRDQRHREVVTPAAQGVGADGAGEGGAREVGGDHPVAGDSALGAEGGRQLLGGGDARAGRHRRAVRDLGHFQHHGSAPPRRRRCSGCRGWSRASSSR